MLTKGRCVDLVQRIPYILLLVIAAAAEPCQINSITPTCSRQHLIVLTRDQTVNPCKDFFAYACNNFRLQDNSNKSYQLVDDQVNLKLIIIMESLYPQQQQLLLETKQNQSIFDKLNIYYKSCVNVGDSSDDLLYLEVLKPGKGLEWPLMVELQFYLRGEVNFDANKWPAHQFDVFALLGQLHGYGLNNVLIQQQLLKKDSVILVERADVELDHTFTKSDLVDALTRWGLPVDSALKFGKHVMATQAYLYSLYQNFKLQPQHNKMLYRRLKQQFPYLAVFLENIYQQKFPDAYRVDLYNTRYFEFLLGKQWSAEEARGLCNYLMLRFLVHVQEDRAREDFSKVECIRDLRRKLDFPVNLLYYQWAYKPDELFYNREIYEYFNKTRHYVMATLAGSNWSLPTAFLDYLRPKVFAITLNIGNLPRNLHLPNIEKFFRNIPDLELNNYPKNHLHLLRHRLLKALLVVNNQSYSIVSDNFRGTSSLPYYDYKIHQIVLPFGMFQPPIYHYSYDAIFKWSILGFELARCIINSILPDILQFIDGQQLDDCVREMGSSLTRARENFVALVSSQVAYRAYVEEQRLQLQPEFSNIYWKKLFFLNLSQRWCRHRDSEWADEVSLMFRNIMNLESFGEAFHCRLDVSGFMLRDTCRIF